MKNIELIQSELCSQCGAEMELRDVNEGTQSWKCPTCKAVLELMICTYNDCSYCLKTNVCNRFEKYIPLLKYRAAKFNNELKIST